MRTALLATFLLVLTVPLGGGAVAADTYTSSPTERPTTTVSSFDAPGSGLAPAAIAVGFVVVVGLLGVVALLGLRL
jgi:hypothetical protein